MSRIKRYLDHERGGGFTNLFKLSAVLIRSGRWMTTQEVIQQFEWDESDYSHRLIRRLAQSLFRCGVPVEMEKVDSIERNGRLCRNNYGYWHYRLRRNHVERWLREIL